MFQAQRRMMGIAAIVAMLMAVTGLMNGIGSRASAHGDDAAHPAHVHTGSCETIGDVVYPLSNVGDMYEVNGTPSAGSEAIGQASAIPVDVSVTTVDAALSDIADGGHTIVVHESAEAIQNYIACGDVGGFMLGPSDLTFGLGELNESGYSGVAWLHDNGDGTTDVSIFVTSSHEEAESGTEAGEASIEIKDFAFNAPSIEIASGTTVTWTNNDSTPHTVSQSGGGFESGKIDPGGTFSFTFDEPGTYDYFCQFHANMKGTIIVN
jgi:plastocyanin